MSTLTEYIKEKTGHPVACGASVGPGWEPIIKALVEDITTLWPGRVQVDQVKEKFGGLRFYYTALDEWSDSDYDKLNYMVNEVEKLCERTCEECGEPGTLRSGSWLKTLCDEHAKGRPPYGKVLRNT